MARTLIKSIAVGIAAGLLCLIVGIIADEIFTPNLHEVKHEPHAATPLPPAEDKPDDFTVQTSEEVSSEWVSIDPYLVPISGAVLIITSAWTYRRLRRRARKS